MNLEKTKGIKTTTSVSMEKNSKNEWVVKLKNEFMFTEDLEKWEKIEYESLAISPSIEKAYSDAVQQILEAMEADEETDNFILQA